MAKYYNITGTIADAIDIVAVQSGCIKGLTYSFTQEGIATLTVSVMGEESDIVAKLRRLPYEITAVSTEGAIVTVTLMDKSQMSTRLKIPYSAIFKSVSREVVELHKSRIIPTDIVDPLNFPEAIVHIKVCDSPYEDDGWRVSSIVRVLGLPLVFPASWDYHVTKLAVKAGTPVVAFAQQVFPFPGTVIRYSNGKVYVGVFDSPQALPGFICKRSYSDTSTKMAVHVRGDAGSVRTIRGGASTETHTERGGTYTYRTNVVKGVFAVLKSVLTGDAVRLPTELWTSDVPAIGGE